MRHFLTTEDWSRAELQDLLTHARAFRDDPHGDQLAGRSVGLVFFNPSLRTRASFQVGVNQLGGHSVVLEPGGGSWPMEARDGVVMDGEAKALSENEDVKEFYLGVSGEHRKSFRDVKHYRRRKRWLA